MSYPSTAGFVAGSDTSRAAAEDQDTSGRRATKLQQTKRLLELAGPLGLTVDELESITEWAHQTASARMREGVLIGWAEDTEMRRPTRLGATAMVRVYCGPEDENEGGEA